MRVASLAFLSLVSAALSLQGAPPNPFSTTLLQDEAIWGDGNAEYAVFQATEKRYGVLRETEVRHIVVREDFAAQEQVKANNWNEPGTYHVFKLNQIITVPTGTYRYDQGHSSFWRADTGQLVKFSSTTNDSCGLAYKQGNLQGGQWLYRAFTYWEGMSELSETVRPPSGALTYDELPFKLRQLRFGDVTLFEAPLLESVIDSKGDRLVWDSAAFAVERVPEGWRVTVKHTRGTDQFTFDAQHPHALNTWLRWDGSKLQRSQLIRIPYWQLNHPGDERFLVPGARYP